MSHQIKELEFKQKSLKLLADPCKLKDIRYNPKNNDTFKNELEYKFNCELSDIAYKQVCKDIKDFIIIESLIESVIESVIDNYFTNQVNLNHNP